MDDDEIQLCNIDPDDINDVIIKIENSFGFKFTQTDLDDVTNFGKLCDAILRKINLPTVDGCTSQQGFYKLRKEIMEVTGINKEYVTPSSKNADIFPKQGRRKAIKQLDAKLSFATELLKPKTLPVIFIRCCLLLSLVSIFINWEIGLLALSFFYSCLEITYHFGNEFKVATLGEAVKQISYRNYKKLRRNADTINDKEVVVKIKEMFAQWLDIPESTLTRDASFI